MNTYFLNVLGAARLLAKLRAQFVSLQSLTSTLGPFKSNFWCNQPGYHCGKKRRSTTITHPLLYTYLQMYVPNAGYTL